MNNELEEVRIFEENLYDTTINNIEVILKSGKTHDLISEEQANCLRGAAVVLGHLLKQVS
jgi:hypothetical protein